MYLAVYHVAFPYFAEDRTGMFAPFAQYKIITPLNRSN